MDLRGDLIDLCKKSGMLAINNSKKNTEATSHFRDMK